MNEEQKRYACHECPNGMKFDCEDYTPRQKGLLQQVCIWYGGMVKIEVHGRGRMSELEEVKDETKRSRD